MTINLIVAAVFGYLLGSIPFGCCVTRAAGLGDVRARSAPATSAPPMCCRTGNKGLAGFDAAARHAEGHGRRARRRIFFAPNSASPPVSAAFIGHIFPVWLGFKGGKGVATYLGVLLGLLP